MLANSGFNPMSQYQQRPTFNSWWKSRNCFIDGGAQMNPMLWNVGKDSRLTLYEDSEFKMQVREAIRNFWISLQVQIHDGPAVTEAHGVPGRSCYLLLFGSHGCTTGTWLPFTETKHMAQILKGFETTHAGEDRGQTPIRNAHGARWWCNKKGNLKGSASKEGERAGEESFERAMIEHLTRVHSTKRGYPAALI